MLGSRVVAGVAGGLLVVGVAGCSAPSGARLARPAWDFGPFAAGFAGVDGSQHATAAGPFFEAARGTNGEELVAVRPFYSRASQTNDFVGERDYVWPVAQSWDFKKESVWRWGFWMGYNHDTSTNDPRRRLWLLPFWFSGKDAKGESYRALFPVYGSIHEFIGRDEINFALFPLRSTSRLNDLETSNWLWPFYSETRSKDGHVYRFRVFPVYAYSYDRDRFEKRAVLWPFWTSVNYLYPKEKGHGWILWPVGGHLVSDHERTVWVVPPFFRFSKGKVLSRYYCPWPFVQVERGRDYHKTYLWPVWGYKHVGNMDSTFVAWPFFWNDHMERGWYHDHLVMLAPVYRHYTTTMKGENGGPTTTTERLEKVWPLMNYSMKHGYSRFHALDLWPIADNAHADRNWTPLWSLYDRSWRDKDLDSRFLWGLYRHQRRGDEANYVSVFPFVSWRRDDAEDHFHGWSILKGLVARDATDHGASWRILYFLHLGKQQEKKP